MVLPTRGESIVQHDNNNKKAPTTETNKIQIKSKNCTKTRKRKEENFRTGYSICVQCTYIPFHKTAQK